MNIIFEMSDGEVHPTFARYETEGSAVTSLERVTAMPIPCRTPTVAEDMSGGSQAFSGRKDNIITAKLKSVIPEKDL